MTNKMKVLIVGTPGSIGSCIAAKLAESGITCDVVERIGDVTKKELNADWERGMVSEIQKLGDMSAEVELDKAEKQRLFANRVQKWLDFAGDQDSFEYHEMADELKGLLVESLTDPDLTPDIVWQKLPTNVAVVANLAEHPRKLTIMLDTSTTSVLIKVDPSTAARLIALNHNMVRSLKWFCKGDEETGCYTATSLSQPDLSDTVYILGDNLIDVHGLDRIQTILEGDEYQVITNLVHKSFEKYDSATFIIEDQKYGDRYGLHTYEEMIKLVFGNEHLNRVCVPMIIDNQYVHRQIDIDRHEDGFLELRCGCSGCPTLLARVALGIKPRGTY